MYPCSKKHFHFISFHFKDERLNRVLQFQAENDKSCQKGGIFANVDRRFLWGPFARLTDPDGGSNLYTVRDKYFDSEEKYNRLVEIKRKVDPKYLFTENMMGVDANNAPPNKKSIYKKAYIKIARNPR